MSDWGITRELWIRKIRGRDFITYWTLRPLVTGDSVLYLLWDRYGEWRIQNPYEEETSDTTAALSRSYFTNPLFNAACGALSLGLAGSHYVTSNSISDSF